MDATQITQVKQMIKDEVNHHEDIDILRFEEANRSINHMSDKIKDATELVHQHALKLQELFDTLKHQGTLDQERRLTSLEKSNLIAKGKWAVILGGLGMLGGPIVAFVSSIFMSKGAH